MVVSVSSVINTLSEMASLMKTCSHMASDPDLVCRKTRSPVVIFEASAFQNDIVSPDSNTCWYMFDETFPTVSLD